VTRTGRCIVAHEAPLTGGFGGEIAARIAERALMSLLAPLERVAGYDTVIPLSRLEQHYFPDAVRITDAAHRAMAYA
jgi:pyruvate dehydrogenase E1 component beta subunit